MAYRMGTMALTKERTGSEHQLEYVVIYHGFTTPVYLRGIVSTETVAPERAHSWIFSKK
jgi:hypothetical protein